MFSTSFNRKINDNVPKCKCRDVTKYFSASLVLFTLNFAFFIFKNNSISTDIIKNTNDFIKSELTD